MEADEVLKLMDSHWFGHEIFTHVRNPPTPRAIIVPRQVQEKKEHTKLINRRAPNLQARSMSDRYLGVNPNHFFDEESEVNNKPKLQKILSGVAIADDFSKAMEQEKVDKKRKKKRAKGMLTKSMSALEFEEVKGFMDLGFVFTDEDNKNSSLVSMIPGLQKWGKMVEGEVGGGEFGIKEKGGVSRPYLSEAWGAKLSTGKREMNNYHYGNYPMMKWRIPVSVNNEVNMKDHLRVWAQNVASTVII